MIATEVGLIGVGLAGLALAENLIACGYTIIGYDISEDRRTLLSDAGGVVAGTAAAVAAQCDRVVLSLPDSDVVHEAIEGKGGVLAAASLPRYIIDTTTGDPDKTEALARRLSSKSIELLDATISGSSQQIRDRRAVLMVGASSDAYAACRDVLDALAERHFHVGPVGSGSKAKLASNLILGLNRFVLAEGLVFAEGLGIDLATFLPILKVSPAYSCAMDVKGEKMIRGDFATQSRVRQHDKDLSLILSQAERMQQELPLTRVHKRVLEEAIRAGDGDLDNSVVIRHLRSRRGGAAGSP